MATPAVFVLLPNAKPFWHCWGGGGSRSPDLTVERGPRESPTGLPSFSLVSFSLTASHHGKAGETAFHAGAWGSLLPLLCPQFPSHTCFGGLLILSSFLPAISLALTEAGPTPAPAARCRHPSRLLGPVCGGQAQPLPFSFRAGSVGPAGF